VEIDWLAKKATSQPSQIQSTTNVKINVNGVNDVLYTYSITTQSVPTEIDDFGQIKNAFKLAGDAAKAKGEAAGCNVSEFQASMKALLDAENVFHQLPATQTGCSVTAPCSITLADAKDNWIKNVQPLLETAKTKQKDSQRFCTADEYQTAYSSSQAALDQASSISASLGRELHVAQSQLFSSRTTQLASKLMNSGKANQPPKASIRSH
jgi:hypothetical protein